MTTTATAKRPKLRREDTHPFQPDFTLPLAAFREAFADAARIVPARSPKPILQSVRLDVVDTTEESCGRAILKSTDLEMWLRREIDCGYVGPAMSLMLPAKAVGDAVRTADGEEMRFALEDGAGRVTMACDGARWVFATEAADLFPDIPEVAAGASGHLEIAADRLALLIRRTIGEARDMEEHGYSFSGLQLEPMLLAVALTGTNGRSLASQQVEANTSGEAPDLKSSPIVPVPALRHLGRLLPDGDVPVRVVFPDASRVVFAFPGTSFSTRLVERRFPTWRPHLPTSPMGIATVNCGELSAAIARVSVHLSEVTRAATFDFGEDELELNCTAADSGEASATVAIEWSKRPKARGYSVGIDPQYLVPMLKALGEDAVATLEIFPDRTLSDGTKAPDPLLLKTEDGFLGMVCPLNRKD